MCTPLRHNTAAQTFIIGPFIDDTDFKTPQTGLTLIPADFQISKAGAPPGTKSDLTNASHIAHGYYLVTVNAGDTGTVGEMHISSHKTGTLVVGKDIEVLPTAIFDATHASGANGFNAAGEVEISPTSVDNVWLELIADHSGSAGSMAEALAAAGASSDPWLINLVTGGYAPDSAGSIVLDALNTMIPQTADSFVVIGAGGINLTDLGGMNSVMKTQIRDHVWTASDLIDHNNVGTMGSALNQIVSGLTDVNVVNYKGAPAPDPLVLSDFFTGNQALDTTLGTINLVTTVTDVTNPVTASNVLVDSATALSDIHLDHLLAVQYNATIPPGVANSLWNTLIEDAGGGVPRFTEASLLLGEDWTSAERDQTRYRIGIDGATAIPAAASNIQVDLTKILGILIPELNPGQVANNFGFFYDVTPTTINTVDSVGGGGGGDPAAVWEETLASHTTPNTMGSAMNDILADTNILQVEWANGGRLDNILDATSTHTFTDVTSDMDSNSTQLAKLGVITDLGAGATIGSNLSDMAGAGFVSASHSLFFIATTGGGGATADQIADAVWLEVLAPHSAAGNAAEALLNAGAAANPWIDTLATYTGSQAGAIVRDSLTGHLPQSGDSFGRIGASGGGLTLLGGMSLAMAAQVKAECDSSISALNDFDPATDVVANVTLVGTTTNVTTLSTGSITASSYVANAINSTVLADNAINANVMDDSAIVEIWNKDISAFTGLSAGKALLDAQAGGVGPVTIDDASVDLIWNELLSGHIGVGSSGKALSDVLTDTNDLVANRTLLAADYITPTEVRTEMVGAISVDTYPEPPKEAPLSTNSLIVKVGYAFKEILNKKEQTADKYSLFNASGTVVDQEANVVDDGTTARKGQLIEGT